MRRRRLIAVVAGLVLLLSLAAIAVLVVPGLVGADPRLANQRSLAGAWVRGAALRPGTSADPDPFRLAALRTLTIDGEGRSSAEVAVTLAWSDGRQQQHFASTDMLPGYARVDDPAAGTLIIATAADGAVSIDDGRRSFSLERR